MKRIKNRPLATPDYQLLSLSACKLSSWAFLIFSLIYLVLLYSTFKWPALLALNFHSSRLQRRPASSTLENK